MNNLLLLGGRDDVVIPEAVDLDGTNDFFSRASDLTGNADGKTFTFSCWFYADDKSTHYIYSNDNNRIAIVPSAGTFFILMENSAGTRILDVSFSVPKNTFINIIASVDLTNAANRDIYINDEDALPTWTTYTDDIIDFTQGAHNVGNQVINSLNSWDGRLAHVFLDYTFRDLSIAANRRLFTTIDSKRGLIPAAGQASLSPILYLPMDDPTTAFVNEGTGGDFTLNGVISRSGRGPNQYNSPASELDGSADFLTRGGALTGAADTKLLTCAFSLKSDAAGIDHIYSTANTRIEVTFTATRTVRFVGKNSAGTTILDVSGPAIPLDSVRTVSASFDLANAANRFIFYGADSQSLTVVTYTDDTIDFTDTDHSVGATTAGGTKFNGDLGDFYLGNEFIDLSASNPFFDADTVKPKYLGESGELPTGSSPLIYLPLRAGDAGSNLGTGGTFTVTSGPFVGARGGSEYWARSIGNTVTQQTYTDYLTNSGLTGAPSSSTAFSLVISARTNDITAANLTTLFSIGGRTSLTVEVDSAEDMDIYFNGVATLTTLDTFLTTDWQNIFIWYDGVNLQVRANTLTDSAAETASVDLSGVCDLLSASGQVDWKGDGAVFYLVDSTIDFSQEANRLKFVDGLEFPVDIQPAIDDGDIPTPLVYTKFKDVSNLGLNSGTGGNFTVTGAIAASADVKG